jgi:hypothetical protein
LNCTQEQYSSLMNPPYVSSLNVGAWRKDIDPSPFSPVNPHLIPTPT